jgi:hypothetical protein
MCPIITISKYFVAKNAYSKYVQYTWAAEETAIGRTMTPSRRILSWIKTKTVGSR